MKQIKILCILLISTFISSVGFSQDINVSSPERVVLIVNASINPSEKEALKTYTEKAGKLFAEAGGKPIGKYKISETIYGDQSTNLILMMQFPTKEDITNVFNSKEYKALLTYRAKAFSQLNIYLGN